MSTQKDDDKKKKKKEKESVWEKEFWRFMEKSINEAVKLVVEDMLKDLGK